MPIPLVGLEPMYTIRHCRPAASASAGRWALCLIGPTPRFRLRPSVHNGRLIALMLVTLPCSLGLRFTFAFGEQSTGLTLNSAPHRGTAWPRPLHDRVGNIFGPTITKPNEK